MSTLREAFCLDAPAGTDLRVVYAAFRSAKADMVLDAATIDAYTTTGPGGSARLVVGGDTLAGTAVPLAILLAEFGHGHVAIATDWAEIGVRWTVLAATAGGSRTVQRTTLLGVDHSDTSAVEREIDEHWDGVDPRTRDVRGPAAAAAVAELYRVDAREYAATDGSAERGFVRRRAAGGTPFPWWRALRLPPRPRAFTASRHRETHVIAG
ncbi:hypothetical protein [Pseudonocardia sp. TRM90224]|uniref:hypothetical protein n=1 Tax=Pseudonocardia sp. TRM90224 TaxID=2812678 RepID=UPI001E2B368C|nr:hypothetical protein [Pseudonocardia sp. TRM90224]